MLDVLVVGGGPAGLALGLAARAKGLEVRVLDRRQPPIDKACGEGLMPDGVAMLERWGVRLERFRPFHGIRYLEGETVAGGRFPDRSGAGVRRIELHRALVARAEEVGVEFGWNIEVRGLSRGQGDSAEMGIETSAGLLRARWLVAADGLRSKLRAAAGLESALPRLRRFGVRRHYALAPWSDCVEVYWADGCEAYVTPVADDEVGVAILWSGRRAGFDALLKSFPPLEHRLAGAAEVSRQLGTGPLHQRPKHVVRGRMALLGDASGYLDAITGEGLSLAFHQAEALSSALAEGDLRAYARAHRRLARLPEGLIRLLLAIERRPWLRRRMVKALAQEPALFDRLLAVHSRDKPLSSVGVGGAGKLLWRLAVS